MACIYGDQPLRVQLTEGGVIHAGTYQKYGGFKRAIYDGLSGHRVRWEEVPVKDHITIVCRRYRSNIEITEDKLVENTEPITCKSCMKLMGLIEEPLSTARYVIVKPSTGEFYKNTNTRCTPWSESINDAYLWKQKHTAEDRCQVCKRETSDGKLLTFREWVAIGRPESREVKVWLPDMEVKRVKLILE